MSPRPADSKFFRDPSARAAYLDWLEEPARRRAEATIETLETIRTEHGPAAALVASVWVDVGPNHHPLIDTWRFRLMDELDEAMRGVP